MPRRVEGISMDPAYYDRVEDYDDGSGICTGCNAEMPEQVEGEWLCDECYHAHTGSIP